MRETEPLQPENAALLDWPDDRDEFVELWPGTIYGVLRDGKLDITDTHTYRDHPHHQCRDVTVLDAASFLDYWQAWADPARAPEAWTDPAARTVTGVLDARDPAGEVIGWESHRVTLKLGRSTEWREWLAKSGTLMAPDQFAEFIEDHLPRIVEPSGADMLEVAQSLQSAVKAEWKQAHRRADGWVELQGMETATAGQECSLEIPAEFTLALPPFKGGALCRIRARFRYRLAGDQIALGYKLDRAEAVEDAAWEDVLVEVRDGLVEQPVPAFLRTGRP